MCQPQNNSRHDFAKYEGTERVWVWTACDFADGERKIEHLAVRFKLQDVADSFKEKYLMKQKYGPRKRFLITPHVARSTTPRKSPCGKMAVAVLEETTRERTSVCLRVVMQQTQPRKLSGVSGTQKQQQSRGFTPKSLYLVLSLLKAFLAVKSQNHLHLATVQLLDLCLDLVSYTSEK